MPGKRFRLAYDSEIIGHMRAIEREYHSLVQDTIETQLANEPSIETRNRKPLVRTTVFGARWELRFGEHNRFRVFYSVHPQRAEVHILAVGVKDRGRLLIGGKEVEL